jgi:hypothetical protein
MHGSYREGAPSAQLVVRPRRQPNAPVIRISMLVGGGLLGVVLASAAPVIAGAACVVAVFGGYGLLGYAWSHAHRAIDELSTLPFPVTHEPLGALGSTRHILSVTLHLQTTLDAPSRDAVTGALPSKVHAHVEGDVLTLTASPRNGPALARLLTTWGLAVHERFGIAEVHVRWSG